MPAPPTSVDHAAAAVPARPRALVGWRLLALFYDLWPAVAMWFLLAFLFALGYTLAGHAPRENIAPFSALQWLLWIACWLVTGLYATVSWRRGGQTLGMRPWRLRLVDGTAPHGDDATRNPAAHPLPPPAWSRLWLRYAVGTLSLLAGGLGFWWAWIDRDRLAWHDRASGTRLLRAPKRPR